MDKSIPREVRLQQQLKDELHTRAAKAQAMRMPKEEKP